MSLLITAVYSSMTLYWRRLLSWLTTITAHVFAVLSALDSSMALYWRWILGWRTTIIAHRTPSYPLRRSLFNHSDGEQSVILIHDARQKRIEPHHVVIVLPGGMTSGDSFYTHQMIQSDLFPPEDTVVHIFHNPGILNTVKKSPVSSLTETRYAAAYVESVESLLSTRSVTLIGFSAGSMLAISLAYSIPHLLRAVIAVHGPDRIRSVFEYHQKKTRLRLDIPFSYSLYRTMVKQPSHTNQNLQNKKTWGCAPWTKGWDFMKHYTEKVFGTSWMDMEEKHWSVIGTMQKGPSKCPVRTMRIVSQNDPIVPLEVCDIDCSRQQFDKFLIQKDGGHCAAFHCKEMTRITREWWALTDKT